MHKLLLTVTSSLFLSIIATTAYCTTFFPTSAQTDSCLPSSQVNLMDGKSKSINCTWASGNPKLKVTLFAGQTPRVLAVCKFIPSPNGHDEIGSIIGESAAKISNLNLNLNYNIKFDVLNDRSSEKLDVIFLLNNNNSYKAQFKGIYKTPDYTPGDSISCTFTPASS